MINFYSKSYYSYLINLDVSIFYLITITGSLPYMTQYRLASTWCCTIICNSIVMQFVVKPKPSFKADAGYMAKHNQPIRARGVQLRLRYETIPVRLSFPVHSDECKHEYY